MLRTLFSECPEIEAEVDFKVRNPATDDLVQIGFDARGVRVDKDDPLKPALERLKGRADWLHAKRNLTDDDRHWLACKSAADFLDMSPNLSAQQKAEARAFLEKMGDSKVPSRRKKALKRER